MHDDTPIRRKQTKTAAPVGSQMKAGSDFHPVLFYVLAFTIAWTAWAPLLLHVREVVELPLPFPIALFVCQTIGAFSPLLALGLIQRIRSIPNLVEGVLRKIRFRNASVGLMFAAALLPIMFAIASNALHSWMLAEQSITILRPERVDELGWALLLVIPLTFVISMVGSPLGEEPGWRGYVLDHFSLQGRGYRGSIWIAVLWWTWHLPLFMILGVPCNAYSFLEMFGHSLLIDSFFFWSGRNLLFAMLYHQGVNVSFLFFVPMTQTMSGLVLLVSVAIGLRVTVENRVSQCV